MTPCRALLTVLLPGAIAACAAGGGVPDWRDAQQVITNYYSAKALERAGYCNVPVTMGITSTQILDDTASKLVIDIGYFWGDENPQVGGIGGSGCFGEANRVFTLAKTSDGDGYSVVSMTGAGRK